jgi:pilus assembly protein CpaB
MKWSIVGLVVVGVVAALLAAVLMGLLRTGARGGGSREVDIMVATQDLPAMSVVDSNSVAVKRVRRSQAPEGFVSDPVQVVGKVLALSVKQDQAFTQTCFAGKGSGVNLAAAVSKGMRAVSLSLTDYAAMEGLLYPGSVVDVLASFRIPREETRGEEVISMTLLAGVQVLAVDDQSVVSIPSGEPPTPASRQERKRLVTLMVTPKQAEQLQIAQKYGEISLAMRNPLETVNLEESATMLSQVVAAIQRRSSFRPLPREMPTTAAVSPRGMEWPVELIRGSSSQVESVPMPQD